MSGFSRLELAVRATQATEVPMDGLACVDFSCIPCIGTRNLGSCSVVLIISSYAAILAHIPPRPNGSDPNDLHAGDRHAQASMERLIRYYRDCQQLFPASSSWVVCAVFRGGVALPDQQRIMESKLREVGLAVDTSQTYPVPRERVFDDQGSVFVDSRGATIDIYVEDRLARRLPRAGSSQTTTVTSTASGTSEYATTTSAATAYSTTLYSTAPSSAYTTTTTGYHAASAPTSSSSPDRWQWNHSIQQYEFFSQGRVQLSQTQMPVNVWVYSSARWDGQHYYALWNGTTMSYH